MPQPTVLVAENVPAFLDLTKKLLEKNGFHVIAVDNPDDARRVLAQTPLAAAVLDVRLVDDNDERDLSGLDVAREASDEGAVPKIILTGFGQYEIARGLTLLQAISQAGGLSKFASQRIEIHREQDDKKLIESFDFGDIRRGREEDPLIRSGDTIIVRKRFF